MRIGYETTSLSKTLSGIGRYTFQLLTALLEHTPENEYGLLSNSPPPPFMAVELSGARISVQGSPPLPIKTAWMQLQMPMWARRARLDVCHFTDSLAPLLTSVPNVVTIHDMSLFLTPQYHPPRRLVTVRPLVPHVARRAAAVITDSHSAKREIVEVLGLPEEKVHVIWLAAPAHFKPVTDPERLRQVADRYRLPGSYLLFVSTIEPRKNLLGVARAVAKLRKDGLEASLVVVGRLGWGYESTLEGIEGLRLGDRLRFIGHVADDDLPAVYALSRGLVYAPMYEGFGLPVLEAMACGTPVITSSTTSTAEVAGDAALLVDPRDIGAIADAARELLQNIGLGERLRKAGLTRAKAFSWKTAALETAAVYRTATGVG